MLSLQRKFIKKKLWKKRIFVDVDSLIDKLYKEEKINEFMTTDTVCTILMINLSSQHPIFERIMSNKYLFDVEFEIFDDESKCKDKKSNFPYAIVDFNEEEYNKLVEENQNKPTADLQEKIGKILGKKSRYVFVSFSDDRFYVGVKYDDFLDDYSSVNKTIREGVEKELTNYKCLFRDRNVQIEKTEVKKKYEELLAHVKAIKLPLSVVDDESFGLETVYSDFVDVYILLEYSDKWPKDKHAVEYAKTAFYCEIYKRSKFKHFVSEDFVVLKYKNVFFKIVILEELKKDFLLMKSLYKSINTVSNTFPNLKDNIRMVKKYLSSHGYYPFYFNDLLVDLVCLCLERINCPSRFLQAFLEFDFEFKKLNVETLEVQDSSIKRFSIFKKLDNLFLDLPESNVLKRLKMLNKALLKENYDLLEPNCSDYDFCLSYAPRKEFVLVENDKIVYKFLDYKILNQCEVRKKAYFYYSETQKIVMVKCRSNSDILGLMYYLLSVTSYKYILINKKV